VVRASPSHPQLWDAEPPKPLHGDLPCEAPSRYRLLSQAPDSRCNQVGRRAGVQGTTQAPFLCCFLVPGSVWGARWGGASGLSPRVPGCKAQSRGFSHGHNPDREHYSTWWEWGPPGFCAVSSLLLLLLRELVTDTTLPQWRKEKKDPSLPRGKPKQPCWGLSWSNGGTRASPIGKRLMGMSPWAAVPRDMAPALLLPAPLLQERAGCFHALELEP